MDTLLVMFSIPSSHASHIINLGKIWSNTTLPHPQAEYTLFFLFFLWEFSNSSFDSKSSCPKHVSIQPTCDWTVSKYNWLFLKCDLICPKYDCNGLKYEEILSNWILPKYDLISSKYRGPHLLPNIIIIIIFLFFLFNLKLFEIIFNSFTKLCNPKN